ncbi:unnamed protein product [Callosobruchus maculatus]|uniref:Uncharacterized protein n=1 Tax=Callosobruchus maculatus TaxID=64391 RepID=A0A653DJX6_CALMS|nr:unnamed protein product [Callosobruchus maculatus]
MADSVSNSITGPKTTLNDSSISQSSSSSSFLMALNIPCTLLPRHVCLLKSLKSSFRALYRVQISRHNHISSKIIMST